MDCTLMTAFAAVQAARQLGVTLKVEGSDLLLEANRPPPAAILEQLVRHKRAVVELLQLDNEILADPGLRFEFEERAAIAEFEGGLTRQDAERLARACCVRMRSGTVPFGGQIDGSEG